MALHPTILEHGGEPTFVILPYAEYLALTGKGLKQEKLAADPRIPADGSIPHEVASRVLEDGLSVVRAWREYLGLTQAEMAARLNVRQPTYAGMEAPDAKPRKSTRARIAAALGVMPDHIDL